MVKMRFVLLLISSFQRAAHALAQRGSPVAETRMSNNYSRFLEIRTPLGSQGYPLKGPLRDPIAFLLACFWYLFGHFLSCL